MPVQPLHSSFTIRPSRQCPQQLQLTFSRSSTYSTLPREKIPKQKERRLGVDANTNSIPQSQAQAKVTSRCYRPWDRSVSRSQPLKPTSIHATPPRSGKQVRTQHNSAQPSHLLQQPVLKPRASLVSSEDTPPRKQRRTIVLPLRRKLQPFSTNTAPDQHSKMALPSAFEPPVNPEYWKQRCFHWQEVCQQARKRVRDMEEDQRQLRRRIWYLEEQVLHSQYTPRSSPTFGTSIQEAQATSTPSEHPPINASVSKALLISPSTGKPEETRDNVSSLESKEMKDRPPTWIVTIPNQIRRCCFYLTDSEGLSDSEDYCNEDYDEFEEEVVEDEGAPGKATPMGQGGACCHDHHHTSCLPKEAD